MLSRDGAPTAATHELVHVVGILGSHDGSRLASFRHLLRRPALQGRICASRAESGGLLTRRDRKEATGFGSGCPGRRRLAGNAAGNCLRSNLETGLASSPIKAPAAGTRAVKFNGNQSLPNSLASAGNVVHLYNEVGWLLNAVVEIFLLNLEIRRAVSRSTSEPSL